LSSYEKFDSLLVVTWCDRVFKNRQIPVFIPKNKTSFRDNSRLFFYFRAKYAYIIFFYFFEEVMSTPFHAKYFAHDISRRRAAGSVQQLTHSLFDACVDLNPHQIEAALFAIQSPLSHGAILADEVGLGKTIEAGLLLTQYWAERRRKLLIISPASLRKQWSNELIEKFHLPNMVLDNKVYKSAQDKGLGNLLDEEQVFIVSIHFAGRHSARLRNIDWDLVVIDEAHKLRNVYRKKNKLAQQIKWAVDGRKKVLLTATPLQNSLMELYGLASIIDDHYFGDAESFRKQFVTNTSDHLELRARLARFCHRTLRNDVTEFIRYTKRRSMTLPYKNSPAEQELYDRISEFIEREGTYSIPKAQRHLMILVLRKILASSRYAITGTLKTLLGRLHALRAGQKAASLVDYFVSDDALEDEFFEDYTDELNRKPETVEIDPERLDAEIAALNDLIALAESITEDAKSETLLKSLDIGFKELKKMKAKRKAIIFTESRRTQEYLARRLEENGFKGKIVLFNGGNNDPLSHQIYSTWLKKNKDSGRLSGSRSIDIRAAIIEHFRDNAEILIATEAAAEGVNLQFCSLLINYDLPWNPQRIEQRIGRVHRYGQLHDVVVINFLNQLNETDCRVYELLDKKFHLFNGVFGASDEILGAVDSGVDFERRINRIYDECRHPDQIEKAFNELQQEMEEAIETKMNDTKQLLLEHFDTDVHSRLKINLDATREHLDYIGARFWELSKYVLTDVADFQPDLQFDLLRAPQADINTGRYHLISHNQHNISGDFLYRLGHPLGEYVINVGRNSQPRTAQVYFDVSNHPVKITSIRKLRGQSGWMILKNLVIESFEAEEYLLIGGIDDKGKLMDQELCDNFFLLRGAVGKALELDEGIKTVLDKEIQSQVNEHVKRSTELNNGYFIKECDTLDRWADDVVASVENDLQNIKRQIRASSTQARLIREPLQQHKLQIELQVMNREKREFRERLFQVEDDIMSKRDRLIEKMEKRMKQEHNVEQLFALRWTVI
jgi:superfamily II DNA or RNA helicase